ncbi:MAG: hydantoinase/oxoprolinase family protein [Proteobacteria bacterium]|nr:hydantoinase/oxoprolinase family protein [Pseudomonadota bacterium]
MSGLDGTVPALAVAVDIGGTFTDVTLVDRAGARLWTAKTPSTPDDPSLGFMAGIGKALERAGLSPTSVGQVFHGTTVATNLILESKGAVVGLITTAGFRHVLELGRQDIPRKSNMFEWVKPQRPVPPERIYDIPGRLDATGAELEPLDEAAVRRAARALRDDGVAAIAVCFLHAFTNAAHERRAAELIAAEHPQAMISLSSDVLPVFREYERSMATILNVYVMPAVSSYVARLERRLKDGRIAAPLLLMKSSGGVTGAEAVRLTPVQTALSGPAAGVVGAQFIGESAGFRDLISVDIGGTSADICLIKDGTPGLTTNGKVGDWPLTLPMIDMTTIGAGGGSIARVSKTGALTVGPESAGAKPGPVCYGGGGAEPTVTDAHLVLGHLPPYLLSGAMRLDVAAARQAIRSKIAEPLGLDLLTAARGILAIVDNHMVGAIRVVSVERGHDPREFALLPFGGAGPLHGGALARLLDIKTIVVPPAPGVLSALGLLVSNLKSEYSRTCLERPPHFDLSRMAAVLAALEQEAQAWLVAEGVPAAEREIAWHASLRYEHQGFELTVPWAGRAVTDESVAGTIAAFHRLHERLYTFAQEDTPVEIVTLRVDAIGRLPRPTLPGLPRGGAPAAAIIDRLPVEFESGRAEAPVYDRARLGAGARIAGPAIVVQLDSTTLLLPGQTAEMHRYGSLIVQDG